MTQEYKEGYEEALKQFKAKLTEVVKEMTLATLEAIEQKKAQKARIEEELRILKLDLEDLKEGKIEKVKERQKKSEVAREVSKIVPDRLENPFGHNGTWGWNPLYMTTTGANTTTTSTSGMLGDVMGSSNFFSNACSGTYKLRLGNKTYYVK